MTDNNNVPIPPYQYPLTGHNDLVRGGISLIQISVMQPQAPHRRRRTGARSFQYHSLPHYMCDGLDDMQGMKRMSAHRFHEQALIMIQKISEEVVFKSFSRCVLK